jgi:hypothetical protein
MRKRNLRAKFREFKYRDESTLNKSYLKYYPLVMRDMVKNYNVTESRMRFLLFAYDYQFFTIDHISESFFYNKLGMGEKIIYPLVKQDLIYKYFNRLTTTTHQAAMFEQSRYNYKVRYALTQKARLLVQRFYRKLEGEEQINV